MVRTCFCLWCLLFALAPSAAAQTAAGTQPNGVIRVPNTPLSLINNSTQWRLEQISADHVRLTGQVEIESGSQTKFFADEIDVYTDPKLRLVASGNVVFSGPEGRIAAERVEFNVEEGTGTFHLATGSMSLGPTVDRAQFGGQDPDVYFYGEKIEKVSDRSYKITRGGFTTCVQPTPRWEVVSESVVINLNEYAIARNMLLRVKGVPLMYLPLIYYPIQDDERATGFLMPTYGTSTLRGQAISNAFFWAMGRSADATFFHDWFTQAGQGMGAEYRYVSGQQSFGNFRFYRFNQSRTEFAQAGTTTVLPEKTSYQFVGYGTQGLGAIRTHQRLDYTSDIVTQQLYQQNLYQASNATRTLETGVSGVWGPLTTSALYQRTETFANVTSSTLYGATPRLNASMAPQRIFGLPIYGSLNSEYAFLPNRSLQRGVTTSDSSLERWDVLPAVRVPLSRLSFLTVNTSGSYRTTRFSRSLDPTGRSIETPLLRRYFAARSDVIGPVFARIWDTPDSAITERMKHVIEPAFSVEQITDIDNYRRVPGTTDPTDVVVGGARRVTYGITNRLFFRARSPDPSIRGATREFVTVGLQQSYYSNPEMSQFDTFYASAFRGRKLTDLSPIALTVRVNPAQLIDANARLEYDVAGGGLQIMTMGLSSYGTRTTTTASLSRRRLLRTSNAETALSATQSLSFLERRATGTYSFAWDIGRKALLSQTVMATYLAQCCGLQVEFQKFKYPQSGPNFPIPSDRRFNVSFVLAGLGTFSNFFGAFGGLAGAAR